MSFMNLRNTEPMFINEQGVKWWIEQVATQYARKPNVNGTKLEDVVVYLTGRPVDGGELVYEYLIVDDAVAVYASQSYEAIGVHIDIMKFDKESS
ncbi:hypothetical protein H1O16_gp147 [Burkholderia phage BcepSaruman]|uniref:Uncharacterized protein n=1 Tax=Burkholderia phage BcepSaruman TaxID=2530032 RepID=A0A4D5ZD12_9CAUD|nr:hypothetical protein H1O16_gp147 [Burkholderia phage BcepSaruman]QBX06560.1 hypothetical protein BcepSaruman_147 [Burkholderia phage BcepSaruman]